MTDVLDTVFLVVSVRNLGMRVVLSVRISGTSESAAVVNRGVLLQVCVVMTSDMRTHCHQEVWVVLMHGICFSV